MGQYTFTWEYKKDYSDSVAQDTAWISQIEFKPDLPISLADIITTNYKFTHVLGGVSEPFLTEDITYGDDPSLQFGAITNDQNSFVELTTTILKDSTISFCRKVSSENAYDFLEFYIDGQKITSWSGELDWTEYAYDIPNGVHIFQWQYIKDNSSSSGMDTAWIANIIIAPEAIALDPPENVVATDGIYEDRIGITWDFVNNSDSYIIYRAPENYGEYNYFAGK